MVLSTVQGIINAFDMSGRQGFLMEMVGDPADLSTAIALNSALTNVVRLLGPAIAGFVIAATSEGWCFLIVGISYGAVVVSPLAMQVGVSTRVHNKASMLVQMREGWDYVSQFRPVRTVLVLFAVVTLMGYPYMVLMPVFAAKVLQGDRIPWDI